MPMLSPRTSRTRNCDRGFIRRMLRVRRITATAKPSGIKTSGAARGASIWPCYLQYGSGPRRLQNRSIERVKLYSGERREGRESKIK